MIHVPHYYRTQLGRRNIAGPSGAFYGAVVRCSCHWEQKVNLAPSRGGQREVEEAFKRHLQEVNDG